MGTDNLTQNQLGEEDLNWLKKTDTAIDAMDETSNHNPYVDDIEVIFSNSPVVKGNELEKIFVTEDQTTDQ